ncbi:hypothetical protein HanPI659440_Chr10g0383421 [Helianthus annuus]|nr:hypothetical protein HanPI659440_Chr10g0383421 [Helianthus annuus]
MQHQSIQFSITLLKNKIIHIKQMGIWSSGMILALGARAGADLKVPQGGRAHPREKKI